MSTSQVLDVIQREAETVIPLPDAMLGASATAPEGLAIGASATSARVATRMNLQRRGVVRLAAGPCGAGINLSPPMERRRPPPSMGAATPNGETITHLRTSMFVNLESSYPRGREGRRVPGEPSLGRWSSGHGAR